VRGIGVLPTTADSAASSCIGLMKAALGLRFFPAAFFFGAFLALFRAPFFAFFFAMRSPLELVNGVVSP
jgi:hypothetical protein